jgi:hypothetical protein
VNLSQGERQHVGQLKKGKNRWKIVFLIQIEVLVEFSGKQARVMSDQQKRNHVKEDKNTDKAKDRTQHKSRVDLDGQVGTHFIFVRADRP